MTYFLKRQSKVHGPVTGDKLFELARSGKVHPTDEISPSKDGPWQSAGSVTALKAIFAKTAQRPVAENPDLPGERRAPAEAGKWFVNITGFTEDRVEGPMTSQQVKDLIDQNDANAKTQVMHSVETNNEWVALQDTSFLDHLEQHKKDDQEAKAAAKSAKKQARFEKKHAEEIAQQQSEQELEERLAQIKKDVESRPEGTGKWKTDVTTDPTDDSTGYSFILEADTGTDYLGTAVRLIIRESNQDIEFILRWGEYTFIGDHFDHGGKEIKSRVGKHVAQSRRWTVSTDFHATFLPGMVDVLHCIQSLLDEETAVFQVTPDGAGTITAVFDVRGLKQAMGRYATEMRMFRELPEVADLYWAGGSIAARDSAEKTNELTNNFFRKLGRGCFWIVVILAMVFAIIFYLAKDDITGW